MPDPIQMQLIKDNLTPGDLVYTPEWVGKDMVEYFKPTGRILEPCRGTSSIYKYLPGADWCEIKEGRDFYAWSGSYDWIITNPPYSQDNQFYDHSIAMAENVVFLLPFALWARRMTFIRSSWDKGFAKHIRFYGSGSFLKFPLGNPVTAIHFIRGYHGETSWSWYEKR